MGKLAIDWVMERQAVRQNKDSGIINDANDYTNETIGDPRYPFDLLRRVITVNLETMKIGRALLRWKSEVLQGVLEASCHTRALPETAQVSRK